MTLSDEYLTKIIDQDHDEIKKIMNELIKENDAPSKKTDFARWKLEFHRKLIHFKTLVQLHFELEEEIGFKNDMFMGSKDHLLSVGQFKADHSNIKYAIDELIQLQNHVQENDDLRLDLIRSKTEKVVNQIKEHEQSESDLINATIKDFKMTGRFDQEPTFTSDQIAQWEAKLSVQFPESYKRVVTSGSYDKATFHFVEPYLDPDQGSFLVFAIWNDVKFAFDIQSQTNTKQPVYILMGSKKPDNRYDDFITWFHLVFELANRPTYGG